jgi:hypothetical protein
MMNDNCGCGPRSGPVTQAQRERIEHEMHLIDDWTTAVTSGDLDRPHASLDLIKEFLHGASSNHDANLRMIGLVMLLGRRCAAGLPDMSRRTDGVWGIHAGTSGATVDDAPPAVKLAVRVMVAFANGNEVGAADLIAGYVASLDGDEVPENLSAVFMHLTNVYMAVDQTRRRRERKFGNVKHEVHVLARRCRATWRRLTATVDQ